MFTHNTIPKFIVVKLFLFFLLVSYIPFSHVVCIRSLCIRYTNSIYFQSKIFAKSTIFLLNFNKKEKTLYTFINILQEHHYYHCLYTMPLRNISHFSIVYTKLVCAIQQTFYGHLYCFDTLRT